jgi:exodeoxyribonuclease VII large subunit
MPEEIYSVSDLTADIRGSLEQQFQGIWIEGEVSNHRLPGSGHHYFTLKDSFAQISCVLFKGAARKNRIVPQDGMKIQLYGDVSVYEARGQYQVIAQVIQPAGSGDLQAKFEELKRKLEAEGLFSSEKKKPLPAFPTSIGIVTSPTGAAIRDILHVLRRRAPWIRIVIQPVRVQGEGAAEEIAQGIQEISEGRDSASAGPGPGDPWWWEYRGSLVLQRRSGCPGDRGLSDTGPFRSRPRDRLHHRRFCR